MSRTEDIAELRKLVGLGSFSGRGELVLRVCDHAENSTQALARDWGAARIQLTAALLSNPYYVQHVTRMIQRRNSCSSNEEQQRLILLTTVGLADQMVTVLEDTE